MRRRSILAGVVVGLATAALMVVLQAAAAGAAGGFWFISRPWLKLSLYLGLGAMGGALVGWIAATRLGGADSRHRWAFAAASLGLLGFGVRGLASAGMVGRPPILGVALHLLVLAALVVAVTRRLIGRQETPATAQLILRSGLALMVPTLTLATYVQIVFLGDRFRLESVPWSLRIGVVEVFGLLGIAVGLAWLGRPGDDPARLVKRLFGGAVVASLMAHGLVSLRGSESAEPVATAPAEAPNVLLIVLDTLRRDAVSAYGVVDGTTPNLDRLAEQGTLWEDAIVPGNWTIPGHASLFTGAVVSRHGAGHGHKSLRPRPAGEETPPLPTLAESFRSRGWRTTAFVCNGQLSSLYGYDRGFSRYYELWRARKGDFDLLGHFLDDRLGLAPDDRGGAQTVRGLRTFFRSGAAGPRPWFVFVNFLEPHAPYDPPLPWTGRFSTTVKTRAEARRWSALTESKKYGGASAEEAETLWQLYLNAVAYQDHLLGEVLDELSESGLDRDTIVLVTSDHGENFGWQGQLSHGVDLNDDLIRIPLVARGPGIPVGVRDPSPASLVDVFPSLLFLTGGDPETEDPGRPGIVLPALRPSHPLEGRARVAEKFAELRSTKASAADPARRAGRQAVVSGGFSLILEEDTQRTRLTRRAGEPLPPGSDGTVEVDDAEVSLRLLELLRHLRESWPHALGEGEEVELDDETRRQLEALGYVGG